MKEVWMVEWTNAYSDLNAAFSTREKAIAYIMKEAERLKWHEHNFRLDCESEFGNWGSYVFDAPTDTEDENFWVEYQCYPID